MDLTSKLKDSAIVSAIPIPKISTRISIFGSPGSKYKGINSESAFEGWDPVMTADEATELPPVIALPHENLIDLYVEKAVSPGVNCPSATTDSGNEFKEVYSISQQSNAGSRRSSALSSENLRTEILDRIGEQHYEDVLFKPKQSRKLSKTKQGKMFVSETESGSDTVSISSVRSTSDEDPWSSERLDISNDLIIAVKPSESSNNVQLNTKSSSEETLIRLGDSISSDIATLPGDTGSEHDGTIINSALSETDIPQMSCKNKRPGGFCLGDECLVPLEIQPDLRSPSSIERDVAHKERILAKVLHMDSLCDGDSESEVNFNGKHTCDVNKIETQEVIAEKTKLKYVTSHSCIFSEEFNDAKVGDEERDDWGYQSESRNDDCVSQHSDNIADSQDEKLASFSSILSYGPPSGSSAPPSNHASLEIFSTSDPKTELRCDHRMYKTVERADQWMQYKVPGTIVNLSLCKYYVCCIDSKDTVYYSSLNGLSLEWQNVDYKAKQVAISPNGTLVWKLYKHRAYYLENPSVKGPFGGKWIEIARNIQWISVSDIITWFVSDGYISVRKQLSSEQPPSPTRSVECNQPVTRICSFQNSVIALTSTGEVLFRSGVSDVEPEGKKWEKINIPCPAVTDIALGCHSTAWIVDQKSAIYFCCNFMAPDSQWWQVLITGYIFQRTTSLQHICNKLKLTENLYIRQQASVMIAAGEDTVWVGNKTTTSIHVNKTQFTGHQWSKVPLEHRRASLKWQKVSAEGIFEDKGQLWLLSTAGDLFSSCSNLQTVHALLLPDDSPVVCVAAATDTAWILTAKGKIYIRQGITDKCPSGKTWKELSLAELEGIRLTHLSCGCDVVWACNDLGDVYMADGPPHSLPSSFLSPAWKTVDKSQQMNGCHQSTAQRKTFFTKVFVGPQTYMVWALDNKKNIYVREGISNDSELGTGWVLVSGIEAVDLSISGTAVWALSPEGGVYCRCGITNTNVIGDYWKKIPGSVTAVTASVSDGLWALDKNHRLLRHHQFTVKMGKSAPTSSVAVNCTSDGDWEVVTCGTFL
ncbi:hypothetical protein B7P43_G12486 [Cryptotermes secundus]|uniref:Tectonin beta-propeller repeat-containing protein n=2 Tax=Cryptotermes secundus TaxID=105785 RepID=A0A2J7QPG3_9NEOP|nr:hypothetical protein B7P43_G12486 [Cryptotermes secundus]